MSDRDKGTRITSLSNPRVKWLVGLRKRRTREAESVTVVEGFDELALAVDVGAEVTALFYCPALSAESGRLSLADRVAAQGAEVVELGEAAFAKVSYRESPDGWMAVVREPTCALADLTLPPDPLLLVCEAVEKPGNLGAMLRTAEAAGVDAVIAASPVADWGNPNVVRASKGTLFAVPTVSAPAADVLEWLQSRDIAVVVATPDAELLATDLDLTVGTAVVVGAEHEGISAGWLEAADHTARLPMVGRVNSLNVATSAAIVVYEALRQRTTSGPA